MILQYASSFAGSASSLTAVDHEFRAGAEPGIVGDQVQDQVRYFLGITHSMQGYPVEFGHDVIGRRLGHAGVADYARVYGVDSNALRGQIQAAAFVIPVTANFVAT